MQMKFPSLAQLPEKIANLGAPSYNTRYEAKHSSPQIPGFFHPPSPRRDPIGSHRTRKRPHHAFYRLRHAATNKLLSWRETPSRL